MSSENIPPSTPDSRRSSSEPLTTSERVLLTLMTIAIPVVLGVARWLTPDPRGLGTHEQLGLPPCTFRQVTGWNCPHCGLTTSFCWFVRGEWLESFRTNPAGLLLAVLILAIWPWLIVVLKRDAWVGVRSPGLTFLYGSAGWLLLSVVIWLIRLLP